MNEAVTERKANVSAPQKNGTGRLGRWIARMPEARIRRFGHLLGSLIYRVDVPHRRIVRRNLGFAYPEWSRHQVQRCSERIFENIGTSILEILQLRYLSAEDIAERVRVEGIENIEKAMDSSKGVVIISAHLGNWELAPLFFSSSFARPMVSVARHVRPQILNRWVTNLRTRFGNQIIDKQGGLSQMMRSLRMGNPLGLLIDQGTKKSEGVEVKFFDRTVSATPAAAMLALRCRAPVYAAFSVRDPDGGFVLTVLPELVMQRTNDLRADLVANTQKMVGVIEKMVRSHPEQWFWVNKRWKRYFPDLYPEYQARRRRRRQRKFKRLAAAVEDGRIRRKV